MSTYFPPLTTKRLPNDKPPRSPRRAGTSNRAGRQTIPVPPPALPQTRESADGEMSMGSLAVTPVALAAAATSAAGATPPSSSGAARARGRSYSQSLDADAYARTGVQVLPKSPRSGSGQAPASSSVVVESQPLSMRRRSLGSSSGSAVPPAAAATPEDLGATVPQARIRNSHGGGGVAQQLQPNRNESIQARVLSTALDTPAGFGTTAPAAPAAATARVRGQVHPTLAIEKPGAAPLLSCWPSTVGRAGQSSSRSQVAADVEALLQAKAAASRPWPERAGTFAHAVRTLGGAFPSFAGAFDLLNGLAQDLASEVVRLSYELNDGVEAIKARVAEEKDAFYKKALLDVIAEKRQAERDAKHARAEVAQLRVERDEELNGAKRELVDLIRRSHGDDHELSHLRQLLASVFQTNAELRTHITTLEESLKRATADKDEPYVPTRHLHDQVTKEFIQASETELAQCRLSTQRALIDSAVTSRSALRAKADHAEKENMALKEELAHMKDALAAAERFAHEQRFDFATLPPDVFYALRQDRKDAVQPERLEYKAKGFGPESTRALRISDGDEAGGGGGDVSDQLSTSLALVTSDSMAALGGEDESLAAIVSPRAAAVAEQAAADAKRAEELAQLRDSEAWPMTEAQIEAEKQVEDKLRPECYTPRPRVPFELQTELGVRVLDRTRVIVEDVCDIALRQHRAAIHEGVRLRNLEIATAWMEPGDVERVVREQVARSDVLRADARPFIDTIPEAEWSETQHFLRTTITPYVPVKRIERREVARMAREFLTNYDVFAQSARVAVKSKMLAPKAPQLWERRRVLLAAPLDMLEADLRDAESPKPVPRGYALSAFLRRTAEVQNNGQAPSEVEFTTLAYNFWQTVVKYRFNEPVCEALILFLDGQMPLEGFQSGDREVSELGERLSSLDTLHAGALPFKQVSTTILQVFQRAPAETWRGALYAIVKTARENRLALVDRLPVATLVAMEDTAAGASELTRYLRRLHVRNFLAFYDALEGAMQPHIKESVAMKALAVLSAEAALDAAADLDEQCEGGGSPSSPTVEGGDAATTAAAGVGGKAMPVPGTSYFHTVKLALERLPRLNASAHLPATANKMDDLDGSLNASVRGRRNKKRGKAKATVVALLSDGDSNDQSLVEWFAFSAVVRSLAPVPGSSSHARSVRRASSIAVAAATAEAETSPGSDALARDNAADASPSAPSPADLS